jgi:putative ABC transport system ATP-binding protein
VETQPKEKPVEPVSSRSALRLEGITRDFFDGKVTRTVLKPLDLEIMTGELTVVAGPSGSGKTTLLTIMGLVLKPTMGRIFVRDEDVTTYSEDDLATLRLRDFGFVFQQAALIPALTILENILIAGGIQGGPISAETRDKGIDLLRDLGLGDYIDNKPQQLSTGQQQRATIARALMNDPVVLLCDEPTSALDVESSAIVLDTLKRLSKDKERGVVLVTHDPRVFPYADRLVKLEDGAVTYDTRGES